MRQKIHEHLIYVWNRAHIIEAFNWHIFKDNSWLIKFIGTLVIFDNTFTSRDDQGWSPCRIGLGLPWWLRQWRIYLQFRRPGFYPWVRKIPWRREWQPTPVFLPREIHRQGILAGYSPWGCKESDTSEWLTFTY